MRKWVHHLKNRQDVGSNPVSVHSCLCLFFLYIYIERASSGHKYTTNTVSLSFRALTSFLRRLSLFTERHQNQGHHQIHTLPSSFFCVQSESLQSHTMEMEQEWWGGGSFVVLKTGDSLTGNQFHTHITYTLWNYSPFLDWEKIDTQFRSMCNFEASREPQMEKTVSVVKRQCRHRVGELFILKYIFI